LGTELTGAVQLHTYIVLLSKYKLCDVTLYNLLSMSDKTLAVLSDVSLYNLMSKVTNTSDVFSDVNPQSNEYECRKSLFVFSDWPSTIP